MKGKAKIPPNFTIKVDVFEFEGKKYRKWAQRTITLIKAPLPVHKKSPANKPIIPIKAEAISQHMEELKLLIDTHINYDKIEPEEQAGTYLVAFKRKHSTKALNKQLKPVGLLAMPISNKGLTFHIAKLFKP